MEGEGSANLTELLNRTGDAARSAVEYAGKVTKTAKEKVAHAVSAAKSYAAKKMFPQPAGAMIVPCPKNRKAERVAERKAKIAASKERLKAMPPGKQRAALVHATERFERNNVAVERARLADDVYNVGQGEPPEGWERVGVEELRKLGMTEDMFPQLAKDFRPELYKDGYYPELYKSKSSVFGEETYVLGFRGTQGKKDGATDVVQAFGGETDHYTRAIKTAQTLKRSLGDRLELTGHSMGGGMATAAGIVTQTRVYAIDPAGVHPATIERLGKKYAGNFGQVVQNFVAEGEVLDTLQNPHSQRCMLLGLTAVSPTSGATLAMAGHRAVLENGTVTYGAPGAIHRVPIIKNAEDISGGKSSSGVAPGIMGRIDNKLNPLRKIELHNPKYVIAGMEQQKADDISVIDSITLQR